MARPLAQRTLAALLAPLLAGCAANGNDLGAPDGTVSSNAAPLGGWIPSAPMLAHDAVLGARFGASVATVGRTVFVGAPGHSPGAAYAFDLDEKGAHQRDRLLSPGPAGDGFGSAVGISESDLSVVVGAPKSGNAYAYPFFKPAAFGAPVSLEPLEVTPDDAFGAAVATDGGRIAVGAPADSDDAGAVHMFKRVGQDWHPLPPILPEKRVPGARFGEALAMWNDNLVVGAPGDKGAKGVEAGAVYVFRSVGDQWYFEDRWTHPSGEAGDRLGAAVTVSKGLLHAGAPGRHQSRGVVYGLAGAAGKWALYETIEPPDGPAGSLFGASVSEYLALVVGAPGDASGGIGGAAYLYTLDKTTWKTVTRKRLKADTAGASIDFGASVAAGYDAVVVGAPGARAPLDAAGAVYRYAEVGYGCDAAADCLSGFCVGGICCESACEHECANCGVASFEGFCTPSILWKITPPDCGGYACNGGYDCPSTCSADEGCARGYACNTLTKECIRESTYCRSPHVQANPGLPDSDCTPFLCASGSCLESCASNADCAGGWTCSSKKRCEARSVPEKAGGCEVEDGRTPPGSSSWLVLILALGGRAARARRRASRA